MIVFLESDKNNFTTYLNPPIKARKVRLVSCSLYNSWHNLINGMVTAFKGNGNYQGVMLPNGHYTPITLAKELAKHGYTLTTGLPHEMTLKHNLPNNFSVTLGRLDALGSLLGIQGKAITNTAIPVNWKVPSGYEVYCNLVHSYSSLGGPREARPSHLMSKFPPKGNPFDLVEYTPISLNYDLSCDLVSELQITIKVDGEVVNFNGRKINLVLSFSS